MRILTALATVVALAGLGACAQLDNARMAVDAAAAVARKTDVEVIYQADIERKRLRALRCMNPMLTPDALAAIYNDPRLGDKWLTELLEDCPQVAGFLGALAQKRLSDMLKLQGQ